MLPTLAKILSELFQKLGLPGVVGEVFAGVVLGPYGLGSIPLQGKPFIQLGPVTIVFAYFGMIIVGPLILKPLYARVRFLESEPSQGIVKN